MKPLLLINRDSLLIPQDKAGDVGNVTDLSFAPHVISSLSHLARANEFDLVMIEQGNELAHSELFDITKEWVVRLFANEGISFGRLLTIGQNLEHVGTTNNRFNDLFSASSTGQYSPITSYIVSNEFHHLKWANELGIQAIFWGEEGTMKDTPESIRPSPCLTSTSWREIVDYLLSSQQKITHIRETSETKVSIEVTLTGQGIHQISTGLGFFDHMLEQLAKHGGMDLKITTVGDLKVDEHHTIEDTGIALGECLLKAIGNKLGMERYGFCLPMDDAVAITAIDFGGRSWLRWEVNFAREYVGDTPTEMYSHFFKSFADAAKANLYIRAEGENEHHKIEAIFKSVARSIRAAVRKDPNSLILPSTKGIL